jgi:hypothetical protein
MCVFPCVYMCIPMCVSMHPYTCLRMYTCLYTFVVRMYMYIRIRYLYMRVHAWAYIYLLGVIWAFRGGKTSYLAVGWTVLGGRKNVLYVLFNNKNSRVMRECSELCEVHRRNSSSSCMYIYVCIYTYIYVFCLYVCICIFSCLYMSCVYKCIYTYVLVDTYGVLYICMYTLILLQACGGRALISAWSTALK